MINKISWLLGSVIFFKVSKGEKERDCLFPLPSLRSMAVLSSRVQERRNSLLPPQSPRGFSSLARLYYLARPTKTAMLRRLPSARSLPRSLWLAPFPLFWSFNVSLSRAKHLRVQRKRMHCRLVLYEKESLFWRVSCSAVAFVQQKKH